MTTARQTSTSTSHMRSDEALSVTRARGFRDARFTSSSIRWTATTIRFVDFILPDQRRTAKKTPPAARGTTMTAMNQSGTARTARTNGSATAPSTATIRTSKTRSTTMDENPCE